MNLETFGAALVVPYYRVNAHTLQGTRDRRSLTRQISPTKPHFAPLLPTCQLWCPTFTPLHCEEELQAADFELATPLLMSEFADQAKRLETQGMLQFDEENPAMIALVGIGEMGGVFARAFLRAGHPVHPVVRTASPKKVAVSVPEPALTLVTVGENDLTEALRALPESWRQRIGLIQNELLPRDWIGAGLTDPTVIVVWFEKKPGKDVKVIIPSPVYGPAAGLVAEALKKIDIPTKMLSTTADLEFELVRKNLYILTANIAGIITGGNVDSLWKNHRSLAQQVAYEVLLIQETLVENPLDSEALINAMVDAFEADPEHGATGRSAPIRLKRALAHAAKANLKVPTLKSIDNKTV